jgi:hypothetical protein
VGKAIEQVRGRPVKLRAVSFPPEMASGVWIDRTNHDLIGFEENTDPEHQLVIIGHEVWHMFSGHCGALTTHGPTALRAVEDRAARVRDLVAVIADGDSPELPPAQQMDVGLHVALRANDAVAVQHEEEAEFFGVRFATGVQAALSEAQSLANPEHLAGRIQVSMAHRFR